MNVTAKTRILILGGSFAGLHAALQLDETLARDADVDITLINRDNSFSSRSDSWRRLANAPASPAFSASTSLASQPGGCGERSI